MKIFAVLAIVSLLSLAILGDYLWRRWMAKMAARRQNQLPPDERFR